MTLLKKYITCYEPLNMGLKNRGFKQKGKYRFLREYNECIQEFDFGHANYGPVKSFGFSVCVSYPQIQKLGEELGAISAGSIGTNIGYITPDKAYKTWDIDASMPNIDELMNNVACDMFNDIEKYAIPFMERFSSIQELINEIEKGNQLVAIGSDYQLPILYFLNSEKDLALSYLKRELERKEAASHRYYNDYPFADEMDDKSSSSNDRFLKEYQTFAKKFFDMLDQENPV